jgi:inosine-uridine nucleoside N-ribohydrolase
VDKNKTLIVMDVDTGIDDALALILALRAPEAEVLAIGTVAGNIEAGQAAVQLR